MDLGSQYDSQIIKLLALTPMTATRLAEEIKVDDGTLALHLNNKLPKDGSIKIVGARGSSPVWGLTEAGQERRKRLGYP
jgi:hypothetical protein